MREPTLFRLAACQTDVPDGSGVRVDERHDDAVDAREASLPDRILDDDRDEIPASRQRLDQQVAARRNEEVGKNEKEASGRKSGADAHQMPDRPRDVVGRRVPRTALGEPAERRPGRSAASSADAGLSQRQVEVLRHIALGRTDREIARLLFLSPRTVEMHVANCLAKLNCRSRAEATRRASELGVLSA